PPQTPTITPNVTALHDALVPCRVTYASSKGGTLTTTPANGVLANDTDEEGDPLTAIVVVGPSHASAFTLNADGSFTYTHNGDTATSDSFTYKANDGNSDSNTVTVTISIVQTNTAPVAN